MHYHKGFYKLLEGCVLTFLRQLSPSLGIDARILANCKREAILILIPVIVHKPVIASDSRCCVLGTVKPSHILVEGLRHGDSEVDGVDKSECRDMS
jgi:hypothetical protein